MEIKDLSRKLTMTIVSDDNIPALTIPEWWYKQNSFQKMLIGFPFIGPERRLKQDLASQLELRLDSAVDRWIEFSPVEQAVAKTISNIIKNEFSWPINYFIPEDLFGVMLLDFSIDMRVESAINIIEASLGVGRRPVFNWEPLFDDQFGDVVKVIADWKTQQGQVLQ